MKSMKLFGLAIVAMLGVLGGCATQGEAVKIPITMPGGEKATIVAHSQSVPDWMLDRDTLKVNYLVKDEVTAKQLAAVAETERACRIYTGTVRPSNLVAVLSSGALYALAGGIGLYIGSGAFAGAAGSVQRQYAEYGAWASGTAGVANGIISTGGQTYTFENCGREVLALFPGYEVKVLQKSPY